jgi:hypothetical protein
MIFKIMEIMKLNNQRLFYRRIYMKFKLMFLTICILGLMFVGCGKKTGPNNATNPTPTVAPTTAATVAPTTAATTAPTATPDQTTTPDAVTTASIVDTAEAFEKAIAKDGGTWIICLTKDIKVDRELLLDGEYKNGKKDEAGKDMIQRKIALYAQDANRNITARYTLTAPKLTINSPEASIQHGTFVGDLYVNTTKFKLVDATVDGNVYFTSEDVKSSFTMDETSKITGKQELVKK